MSLRVTSQVALLAPEVSPVRVTVKVKAVGPALPSAREASAAAMAMVVMVAGLRNVLMKMSRRPLVSPAARLLASLVNRMLLPSGVSTRGPKLPPFDCPPASVRLRRVTAPVARCFM